MAQDLRTYLDLVKRRKPGDFEIVSKPVDPRFEITALVVKLEREAKRRPGPALREREGHEVSGAHQPPRQPAAPGRGHERRARGDPGDVPLRDGQAADPEGRAERARARGRPRRRPRQPLRSAADRPSRGRRRGLRDCGHLVREGPDARDLELRLQPVADQGARHDVDPPDDRQASLGVPADRRGAQRALAAGAGDRRAPGDRARRARDRLDRRGRARHHGRALGRAARAREVPDLRRAGAGARRARARVRDPSSASARPEGPSASSPATASASASARSSTSGRSPIAATRSSRTSPSPISITCCCRRSRWRPISSVPCARWSPRSRRCGCPGPSRASSRSSSAFQARRRTRSSRRSAPIST